MTAVDEVLAFLSCRTPDNWFRQASTQLRVLLIDHANCEKKAAGTALSLMYRYVDRPELLQQLSRLAREELRHFEQVHTLLCERGFVYTHLTAGRYAAGLRSLARTAEPDRLVDNLLVGAVVEARSCERFLGLSRVLDQELASFYERLLTSEARHFRTYLALADRYAREDFGPQLEKLLARDAQLTCVADTEFRFHSGPPG